MLNIILQLILTVGLRMYHKYEFCLYSGCYIIRDYRANKADPIVGGDGSKGPISAYYLLPVEMLHFIP